MCVCVCVCIHTYFLNKGNLVGGDFKFSLCKFSAITPLPLAHNAGSFCTCH